MQWKMITDMKIQKSITFNKCSVRLFNENKSLSQCDVLLRLEYKLLLYSTGYTQQLVVRKNYTCASQVLSSTKL